MHLGEHKIILNGKEVKVKFGMLFWKLILAHYGKEFNELGNLLKDKMLDTEFMLYVFLYGHKAHCQLNGEKLSYTDEQLIEEANDKLQDDDWKNLLESLLDSKLMGKSWLDTAMEVQKKTKESKAA